MPTSRSSNLSRRTFTVGLAATGLLGHTIARAAAGLLTPVPPTPPTNKLVVYQIVTRLFGNQQTANKPWGSLAENGVGKFNDITDKALQEIKKMGVSHVWYTGVIEHATMTGYSSLGIANDNPLVVKGRAGSPYAIKDYYDVDPDLAVDVRKRMAEFESLVKRSHANGLQVIIDFVPNHLARQYSSDAKPEGVQDLGQTDDTTKAFDPQNNFYYLPDQPFQPPAGTLVPEGTIAPDYEENPAKATGNDVFKAQPDSNDWYETIKLNYGVDYQNGRKTYFDPIPGTWIKMRDILLFWAAKGVDGFRCDMAEMVPVEFWGWVIPQIKASRPAPVVSVKPSRPSGATGAPSGVSAAPTYAPLVFIAEIYNPQQYANYIETGKFDYLYDKVGLYDSVRALMEGKGSPIAISRVCQGESGTLGKHMLRFLENHDEQRIAATQFANDPWTAVPAMTLSATLQTGPVMVYAGQEVGVKPIQAEGFQGDDGRTTIFDYWGIPEFQAWTNGGAFDGGKLTADQKKLRQFYVQLGQLVNASEAIRNGAFYDLQQYGRPEKLFSYLRYSAKQKLLIVCNFDRQETIRTQLQIPADVWKAMKVVPKKTYTYRDIFLTKTTITAGQIIPVTVPPLGALVLTIS
ncbi:alpha-amylase family glycosyl hydrolase [Fibrella forsythiae]|uniref:Alpha-amylase n=1 Tax=Fibrella forsythiae TaxID=2817061 RepID=A0ABS3JCD5_9BACT|nr:alpha-amylase family glycosyl hydrolase [Fibrella forsythiae]MBO0947647.1 alpha-amylase [Fibrella forsythiae]